MKKYIRQAFNKLGYTISRYHEVSADQALLMKKCVPVNDVVIDGDAFNLKRINLSINKNDHLFMLDGYSFLVALYVKVGAVYSISEDNRVIVDIDNHRVYVTTWEEILILKEIYIDGIYNLNVDANLQSVFIDIGMNVGFTSLFFAEKEWMTNIYSFEPFKDTYLMALENLKLNPSIESKVQPKNVGLGNADRIEVWDYNADYKGSMGVSGLPAHVGLDDSKNRKIEVAIKDAAQEITNILRIHEDKNIVMKIDCEGAEYEILEELHSKGILKSINSLMIEWHVKGPKILLDYLSDNGFNSFSFNEYDSTIGMIYAVRR